MASLVVCGIIHVQGIQTLCDGNAFRFGADMKLPDPCALPFCIGLSALAKLGREVDGLRTGCVSGRAFQAGERGVHHVLRLRLYRVEHGLAVQSLRGVRQVIGSAAVGRNARKRNPNRQVYDVGA